MSQFWKERQILVMQNSKYAKLFQEILLGKGSIRETWDNPH